MANVDTCFLHTLSPECLLKCLQYLPPQGADRWMMKQTCRQLCQFMKNSKLDDCRLNIRQPITQRLSYIVQHLPEVSDAPIDITRCNGELLFPVKFFHGLLTVLADSNQKLLLYILYGVQFFVHNLEREDWDNLDWLISTSRGNILKAVYPCVICLDELKWIKCVNAWLSIENEQAWSTTFTTRQDEPIMSPLDHDNNNEYCKLNFPDYVLDYAILYCSQNVVDWLIGCGHPVVKHHMLCAANAGNIELVQRLHSEFSLSIKNKHIKAAAMGRQTHMVRWLKSSALCTYDVMEMARVVMRVRSADLLDWYLEHHSVDTIRDDMVGWALDLPVKILSTCVDVKKYPLLPWLQQLMDYGFVFGSESLVLALRHDYADVVEWMANTLHIQLNVDLCLIQLSCAPATSIRLIVQYFPSTFQQCDMHAAWLNENQDVWQFMLDSNFIELNFRAVMIAVRNGRLPLLKWLHQHQCSYSHTMHDYTGASFEILQYLYTEMNVALSWQIMALCVMNRDVRAVQWLIDNNCPLAKQCWYKALLSKDATIIAILRRHKCPGSNTWTQFFYDWFPWLFTIRTTAPPDD